MYAWSFNGAAAGLSPGLPAQRRQSPGGGSLSLRRPQSALQQGASAPAGHRKKGQRQPWETGADRLHPGNPVLPVGQPGDPDHPRSYYYGTVLHIGDEFRMWYTGHDKDNRRLVCYAVSRDGVEWKKPNLGLGEYNGSRDNNLVLSDAKGLRKNKSAFDMTYNIISLA